MKLMQSLLLATALSALGTTAAMATPQCVDLGYGSLPGAKGNKLYLYFSPTDDATYPNFGDANSITQPSHRFDISELPSYTGTATDLKNAIFDVVSDDYCEFNVEVLQTTTRPTSGPARRNVVAIGTDTSQWTDAMGSHWVWGLAQNVDTGDATAVDYAHVWAGTYQFTAGGAGGALNGANSTLERWARSIGGTAAHEGGHNYGLSHSDGLPVAAGEDVLTHHLMAKGSNYTDEQRAAYRRHFSNHEYEVLAANVGLSVQTMWNWDFVNPNAETAVKVRINFLSSQPSMTVSGPYLGDRSPWNTPTVSGVLGTQSFQGTSYNKFQVTWSTAKSWTGGSPGQVAGGQVFHVGTGFSGVNYNTTNPIIITSVDLIDASNNVLTLHPRINGFDTGALDASDGAFNIQAINFDAAQLIVSDIRVAFLPRVLSIDSMLPGQQKLTDIFGQPIQPWREARTGVTKTTLKRGQAVRIPVAHLAERPHFVETVDEATCKRERGDRNDNSPDTAACRTGTVASLFPSTTTYVSATVIEPDAKHWDREKQAYVTGPVESRIFYQVAGIHPDLNRNRIDDFVEIAQNPRLDANKDGVIDAVQRKIRIPVRATTLPKATVVQPKP